jgi:hypothetical protein
MGSFRRLPRGRVRLDALDLYSRVVERGGTRIDDRSRIEGALSDVRRELLDVTSVRSTLHGWRVQALFEAIVASLGRVRLLKLEDAGDVFFGGESIKPPDFRIVTAEEEQILVEVKNLHQRRPHDPYRIRRPDLASLVRYTELVGVGVLKFAIYWSRWNLWTLVSESLFQPDGPRYLSLPFLEAMKANEMGSLGDQIPATEWPIGLTFFTDPGKPRRVKDGGLVDLTIGHAEYTVAGRVVTSRNEQRILYRLILYGGWHEEAPVQIVEDQVLSFSFLFSPDEPPPAPQRFAMHAPLSSIYSTMFNHATMDERGEVTELRIDIDPGALADLIPDDYRGDVLQIWRFQVFPEK